MFNTIARPFGMLLMFLYDLFSNYGVAIFLTALIIKVILLPFQMKSKRGMMQQARLKPKIDELQKKHGTNKAKINEETMKIYKEAGVSPASGCLWGFLPLPIMLALFQVIRQPITLMMGVAAEQLVEGGTLFNFFQNLGFSSNVGDYYMQIAQSQEISQNFAKFAALQIENLRSIDFSLGIFDLSLVPQWDYIWNANTAQYANWFAGFVLFLIPLISGGLQFLATRISQKMNPQTAMEGQAKSMNKMLMFMPLFSVYIGFITPAALGFYWTISTALQIVQDVWLTKVYTKKLEAEEAVKNAEREKKEAEIEEKRRETERKRAEGIVEVNPNVSKRKKQKSERQVQLEKQVDWQKKMAPKEQKEEAYEPSRVGKRRYARGRAYDPDRYGAGGSGDDVKMIDELEEPETEAGEAGGEYAANEADAAGAANELEEAYGEEDGAEEADESEAEYGEDEADADGEYEAEDEMDYEDDDADFTDDEETDEDDGI